MCNCFVSCYRWKHVHTFLRILRIKCTNFRGLFFCDSCINDIGKSHRSTTTWCHCPSATFIAKGTSTSTSPRLYFSLISLFSISSARYSSYESKRKIINKDNINNFQKPWDKHQKTECFELKVKQIYGLKFFPSLVMSHHLRHWL